MKSAAPLALLLMLLLLIAASANATTIGFGGSGGNWYSLVLDYKSQFGQSDGLGIQVQGNYEDLKQKLFTRFPGFRPKLADGNGYGAPIPEPSAALVFAAGLLLVAPKLRRRR